MLFNPAASYDAGVAFECYDLTLEQACGPLGEARLDLATFNFGIARSRAAYDAWLDAQLDAAELEG